MTLPYVTNVVHFPIQFYSCCAKAQKIFYSLVHPPLSFERFLFFTASGYHLSSVCSVISKGFIPSHKECLGQVCQVSHLYADYVYVIFVEEVLQFQLLVLYCFSIPLSHFQAWTFLVSCSALLALTIKFSSNLSRSPSF